jgi:hypothetical protein
MANYVWVPKIHITWQTGYVDKAVVRYRVIQFGKLKHTVSPYDATYSDKADQQKYPVEMCFTEKADAEKKLEEMAAEAKSKLAAMSAKLDKPPRTIDNMEKMV